MNDQLALSMRGSTSNARDFMGDLATHGFARIQIDSLHPDFRHLTDSGLRDLSATLRRNGLRAGGVDFLLHPTDWESDADQSLAGFARAMKISSSLGRVPVSVCIPPKEEITEIVVALGSEAGVLIAAHGSTPLENPRIGWGLPVALLAKEENPMESLAGATFGPIALRLTGNVAGTTTLEIDEETTSDNNCLNFG